MSAKLNTYNYVWLFIYNLHASGTELQGKPPCCCGCLFGYHEQERNCFIQTINDMSLSIHLELHHVPFILCVKNKEIKKGIFPDSIFFLKTKLCWNTKPYTTDFFLASKFHQKKNKHPNLIA